MIFQIKSIYRHLPHVWFVVAVDGRLLSLVTDSDGKGLFNMTGHFDFERKTALVEKSKFSIGIEDSAGEIVTKVTTALIDCADPATGISAPAVLAEIYERVGTRR